MIAHENRILWLPGDERSWDEDGGSRSPAGVRISADNATMVAAVFACVRILSETVASLPLHVLERLSNGGKRQAKELPLYRRLHSQPNAWQTSFEWREQLVRHVALWGDAYSEIKPGASGAADQVLPLHPSRMKVETIENDRLRYSYREAKGRQTVYSQEQILHVRGPSDDGVHGESIAESCRDAIALARACGAENEAGPGTAAKESRPVNLARPCQRNRIAARTTLSKRRCSRAASSPMGSRMPAIAIRSSWNCGGTSSRKSPGCSASRCTCFR